MFKNYLLTAWRNILKNRLFSAINVFGLAIGMMSCILILLYVKVETSYDKWMPEGERIVRLHSAFFTPGREPFQTVRSAGRQMEAIKAYASAEIEDGVRLLRDSGFIVIKDDVAFDESAFYVDGSFFNVIDLPFAHGSAETSFANPMDLVITEEMAIKFFGRTNVIGETMTVCCMPEEPMDLKVGGVIKNLPEASHMNVDFLIHMDPPMFDFAPNLLNTWNSVNVYTYFKMKEGVTAQQLKDRIYYWLDNESPYIQMMRDRGMPEDAKVTDVARPNVMPLDDLHLHARKDAGNMGDLTPMGDMNMVYTFSVVALMILLIASINFMNLATARAAKRAREVALRKVLGASRRQVAVQFLGEALGIAIMGFLLALVGVELLLPTYSEAIGQPIEMNLMTDLPLLLSLVAVAVLVGLLAGSYPAAFLSRFLPARVLKANKSSDVEGGSSFRGLLVVFQFAISIGLAVCTAVVYGQTLYAKNMDVGYTYENKLALGNMRSLQGPEQRETLRERLANLPGVTSAVLSSDVPSQDWENNTGFRRLDRTDDGDNQSVGLNYYSVGYDFMEAYDITPIAGRTFSAEYGTDMIRPLDEGSDTIGEAGLILNESAVRALGYARPEDAVGQKVQADVFRIGLYNLTIVGVVPDLYFRSIRHGIRPSAYFMNPDMFRSITISFDASETDSVLAATESLWREVAPLTPISREFVSEMMAAQYDAEERQAQMFAAFAVLAIVVACLGLYGLASFTAEQRTKEIGIRKVLGATIMDIVRLLVWQFSRPVLIANLIAWPAAWYVMSGWLEGFQYRLGDSFLVTTAVIASVVALIIAWMTVASRAVKVAQANPIHALRYE